MTKIFKIMHLIHPLQGVLIFSFWILFTCLSFTLMHPKLWLEYKVYKKLYAFAYSANLRTHIFYYIPFSLPNYLLWTFSNLQKRCRKNSLDIYKPFIRCPISLSAACSLTCALAFSLSLSYVFIFTEPFESWL